MEQAAEWVDLASLHPWADNPRKNRKAVEPVQRSIVRFGFGAPLVARAQDRRIISGHTRRLAVLGLPKVWETTPEDERGSWHRDAVRLATDERQMVPVRLVQLPEKEAEALALADNRIGEIADWADELSTVLEQLKEDGVEVEGLGWSEKELRDLEPPSEPWLPNPSLHKDPSNDVTVVLVEITLQVEQVEEALPRLRAVVDDYKGATLSVA